MGYILLPYDFFFLHFEIHVLLVVVAGVIRPIIVIKFALGHIVRNDIIIIKMLHNFGLIGLLMIMIVLILSLTINIQNLFALRVSQF